METGSTETEMQPSLRESGGEEPRDESDMAHIDGLKLSQGVRTRTNKRLAESLRAPKSDNWRGLAVSGATHRAVWSHATASASAGPATHPGASAQATSGPTLSAKQRRAQDKKRHRASKRAGPNPQHPHCRKSDLPREGSVPERRQDSDVVPGELRCGMEE